MVKNCLASDFLQTLVRHSFIRHIALHFLDRRVEVRTLDIESSQGYGSNLSRCKGGSSTMRCDKTVRSFRFSSAGCAGPKNIGSPSAASREKRDANAEDVALKTAPPDILAWSFPTAKKRWWAE